MRTLATIAFMLLVVAFAAPAAHAQGELPLTGWPGQHHVDDPQLNAEVQVALKLWADRDVVGCASGVATDIADNLGNAGRLSENEGLGGRDAFGRCTIVLLARFIFRLRDQHKTLPYYALDQECLLVAHEVGHGLGQEHTSGGVMAAAGGEVPWACKAWRKSVLTARAVKARLVRR